MQVEVITRIIFKIPEEADAAEKMQNSIMSKPCPDVYTRIVKTGGSVEIYMSRCQEGPIDRQTRKLCITCKYATYFSSDCPCKWCINRSNWRPLEGA